jgi:DNA-binding CsgD family transcriptional regulator
VVHTATLDEAARRAAEGDWASARATYEALLGDGESARARDGLARACWWLGDLRSAVEHGERAFALYQQEGRFAEAAMVGIHLCVWFLANYDNATAAGGWLSRAQHLAARSGDPVVMGWTDLVSGYLAEEQDEGRRRLERAAAAAENTADVDLATMALADLGLWHVTAGEVDQGVAMLDEAMAATLAEPRGMLEVVVWSSCNMLAACSLLDDLKRATDWCRAADRFMETYGCPFLQARCRAHYGRLLVATGRWAEAEAELDRALAMTADTGRGPRTEALTALAELRLRRGEPEAALRLLEDADPTPWGAATQAACLSATGRAEEARLLLHGQVAVHDPKDPAYPALVAALAETSLATGRTEEATLLVAPDATACTAPAFPRGAGLLARAAGLVAATRGDHDTARAQLGFALEVFSRLELPFEAARTELDLAGLLETSAPEAAIARAASALKRLEVLGARREAAQAAAFLRSHGVTPPPGPRSTAALSSRERDVLLLLSQGLSNPEIAERLYLSRRTVGHHVSSILRKLGVRSRSEAAAYAARTAAWR